MSEPAGMVDLVFPVRGATIARDHALLLAQAVATLLPWWAEEPEAGVLPLWGLSRSDQSTYVGGRARLTLRVPPGRAAAASLPAGTQIDIGGVLTLGAVSVRTLGPAKVVHSPFVVLDTEDEAVFIDRCRAELAARGMAPEMVCGRARQALGPEGPVRGYSVMLYGLRPEQTVALQERGIGRHRALGCGIFVPHKNVATVIE